MLIHLSLKFRIARFFNVYNKESLAGLGLGAPVKKQNQFIHKSRTTFVHRLYDFVRIHFLLLHMFLDDLALGPGGCLFPGLPVLFGRRRFRFPKNGPYPMTVSGIGQDYELPSKQLFILFHQGIPLIHIFYIVHPLKVVQAVSLSRPGSI